MIYYTCKIIWKHIGMLSKGSRSSTTYLRITIRQSKKNKVNKKINGSQEDIKKLEINNWIEQNSNTEKNKIKTVNTKNNCVQSKEQENRAASINGFALIRTKRGSF